MSKSVLSSKLKDYRTSHSFTKKQFAELLGVTVEDVSKWEAGETYPDEKELTKISEVLKLQKELLMGNESEVKKQKIFSSSKIVVPCLVFIIFVLGILTVIDRQTINKQQTQINSQKSLVLKSQQESDKLYGYSVSFVLAPQTPYTDFSDYIKDQYDVDDVQVNYENDYVIIHFQLKAHNNDQANYFFNEIKSQAPNLSNSEIWMTI